MTSAFPQKTLRTFLLLAFAALAINGYCKKPAKYYYQLKIYRLTTKTQEEGLDTYLKNAYVPALHRAGIPNVGVFKAIAKDSEQLVYVFVPFATWKQVEELDGKLAADNQYQTDGSDYINAAYNKQPYRRMETVLLKAFDEAPIPTAPQLTAAKADRVYELRSYEGPTEKLYVNKVQMFNKGNEVGLFKRLGFNAVFYSEVIAGSHMPNLMYMTTFNSMAERDKHWEAFNADPEWKTLVVKPEYQHNVSKADIMLLKPTDYSDY